MLFYFKHTLCLFAAKNGRLTRIHRYLQVFVVKMLCAPTSMDVLCISVYVLYVLTHSLFRIPRALKEQNKKKTKSLRATIVHGLAMKATLSLSTGNGEVMCTHIIIRIKDNLTR